MSKSNNSIPTSDVGLIALSCDPFSSDLKLEDNFEPYTTFNQLRCGSASFIPYGRYNNFPSLVSDIVKSSPTSYACANIISKVIVGNGLEGATNDPDGLTSWDQLFRQITSDYIRYRSFAFRVALNYDGHHKTIKYQPWSQVRLSADRTMAHVTLDWTNLRSTAIASYPIYAGTLEMYKEYMFVFQDLEPGSELFYSYAMSSLLPLAEVESGIAKYFRGNAATGFMPDIMLTLSTKPSDPEEFKRKFNTEYSGSSNAGKVLIAHGNGSTSPLPSFTAIPKPDLNKYNEILDKVQDNIISYFCVPKQLLGKDLANGFSNGAEELLAQCAVWEKFYISDQRQFIVDSLNKLFRELNYDQRVSVSPFDIRSLFENGVDSGDVAV